MTYLRYESEHKRECKKMMLPGNRMREKENKTKVSQNFHCEMKGAKTKTCELAYYETESVDQDIASGFKFDLELKEKSMKENLEE